jgi:hypothetical protein
MAWPISLTALKVLYWEKIGFCLQRRKAALSGRKPRIRVSIETVQQLKNLAALLSQALEAPLKMDETGLCRLSAKNALVRRPDNS